MIEKEFRVRPWWKAPEMFHNLIISISAPITGIMVVWMSVQGIPFIVGFWLSRKPIWLAVFSFLTSVFWVGLLLDVCSVFLMPIGHTWEAAVAVFIAGFPANLMQGICSVVVMLLFGKPLLERLDRIIIKYNMLSCEE